MSLSRRTSSDYSDHTILVTGASSGIGAAFARAFAQRRAALVLVARRRVRLEDLARELRETYGATTTVIPLDLSSPAAASELQEAIATAGVAVTSVVNNAGFGTFGAFAQEDPARIAQEIAVDVATPVQLSRAFLPSIIDARGFLINVASMAAYSPTPRMAVYGAAKAFVLSFTEALWAEVRGTGATVFALSPGATSTEFNAVVGTDDATAGTRMRTSEDVVATALAHLESRNPGPSAIDGAGNRIAAGAGRFMSRRSTARLMHWLTDPSRRARPSAAG